MFAVFHHQLPDGRYRATSESYAGWSCVTDGSLADSVEAAQKSLRGHILATLTFHHYEVPPANRHLRPVA